MNISLYQTSSSNNTLFKSLASEKTLQGILRSECSVLTPIIEIETDTNISAYNYAYIGDFGRYYYITDIVAVTDRLWKVSLKCDVLMSYANEISSLQVNVKRQKTEFNLMLEDNQLPLYADDRIQCYNFPISLTISPNQFKYYLTLVGGGE